MDQSKRNRHHNQLRIFDGNEREAIVLARLDDKEELILLIDSYKGSIYHGMDTMWEVTWHDSKVTWESYRALQNTMQLTEFAGKRHYLASFEKTAEEFKAWCKQVNDIQYVAQLQQRDGYFPIVDV